MDDYIKIYLDISFKEKDKVKKLGAKFDSESKRWFICKKQSKIFSQWIENNKRIYLDIPFEFVEDVKKIGGRKDKDLNLWYINKYNEDFEDFVVNFDKTDTSNDASNDASSNDDNTDDNNNAFNDDDDNSI